MVSARRSRATARSGEGAVKRLAAAALLMGGIALAQAIVYGPSLAGRKILLPVDILGAYVLLPKLG